MAGAVDTVERFQGGERDLIIVSATVSDLAYAQSESDFLLEPRRLTVAVSRPKRKLIVLASQALFTLMPADLDDYERGALWKQLRHACVSPPLWTGEYGGLSAAGADDHGDVNAPATALRLARSSHRCGTCVVTTTTLAGDEHDGE